MSAETSGIIIGVGKIDVVSFNFALFALYFFLVIFIGWQLIRIAYYRHKIMSFKVWFFIQCFFSALLRSIFFLVFDYVTAINWLYLIVYWIPINIQYSTFSLLVVYYAHLQHKQKTEWYSFKRKYFAAYIITNLIFLILAIIWIGLGIQYDSDNTLEPAWLDQIHSYFTSAIFFLLVIVLAWHTYQVYKLMKAAKGTQTVLVGKVSWTKILGIAIALFCLFTSRTLYDFITAVDTRLVVQVSAGSDIAAMITFIALLLWEIIPIILVLFLFGNVSATTLGAFSKPENKKVNTLFRQKKINDNAQDQLLKASLFNDPKRYDSDDETTPLRGSPMNLYGNNSPYFTGTNVNPAPQDLVITSRLEQPV